MQNDDRIYEVQADMLIELKGMRGELNGLRTDVQELRVDVEYMKQEQQKTNLAIGELRLSDHIPQVLKYEKCITRLEDQVFPYGAKKQEND
ncbi:MAG: hypothetical protein LW884_09245 [Bacteroidetes bacterium]|jgi:hypothetical protein|nr:hypothetical protein [Bacteroidota bacterium]